MSFGESVISFSAALLGMLPKGLVLLISVSLAAGVIRLAKMKILVQNIYSLETLAHVDVLCLDKTGTITDGKMKVNSVIPLADLPRAETENLLRSYLAASDDNNATFQAIYTYIYWNSSIARREKYRFLLKESGVLYVSRKRGPYLWERRNAF